jgi:S1-C subfamily serine protease
MLVVVTMSLTSVVGAEEVGSTQSNIAALGFQWRDSRNGVIVDHVEASGQAAKLGLARGDVLIAVNGQEVNTADSFADSLSKYAPGDMLRVEFARGQEARAITLAMPDSRVNMFGALLQPGADGQIQVGAVSEDSPAERAGLQKADIVLSMAGHRPGSLAELSALITRLASDEAVEPIEVEVKRPRPPSELTLLIERSSSRKVVAGSAVPIPGPSATVLGISVTVQGNQVVVVTLSDGGPAALAGIQPGDILLRVGGKPIASFETLQDSIAGMLPGREVEVELQRGNQSKTLRVIAAPAKANGVDVALHAPLGNRAGAIAAGAIVENPDLAALATEVRLLKARIEALEEIVKRLASPPIHPQPR